MTVRELAARLGLKVEGEDARIICNAAPIESAGPQDLTFAGSRKIYEQAARSEAACIIAPPDYPAAPGQVVIRSSNPRGAFAGALMLLFPRHKPVPGIHPSANIADSADVDNSCEIGPNVSIGEHVRIEPGCQIGHGCCIGDGVQIGTGSLLHPNVTIYPGVRVGARAVLHSGCVLGADGFGFVLQEGRYEKFPQVGIVEIGDDVEIGANSCVDRAALGTTRIGDGTKLDNMVHIGHNCQIGKHVVIAAQTGLSGGVVVEDYAVIGGQVGIGDKARIQTRAVLGSGSGILTSKIVRSGSVVWGTPARPLKEHLEGLAHLRRLPGLKEEIDELRRRLTELEGRQ